MINKCRSCSSIWVCWNWFHDRNVWGHECWNCADCWTTPEEVTDGISYIFLKFIGRFFVDDDLFERNLSNQILDLQQWPDEDWAEDDEKK